MKYVEVCHPRMKVLAARGYPAKKGGNAVHRLLTKPHYLDVEFFSFVRHVGYQSESLFDDTFELQGSLFFAMYNE